MQTYGYAELLEAFRRYDPERKSTRVIFDMLWKKYSKGKNAHLSKSQIDFLKSESIRIFCEKYEPVKDSVPVAFLTRIIRSTIISGSEILPEEEPEKVPIVSLGILMDTVNI